MPRSRVEYLWQQLQVSGESDQVLVQRYAQRDDQSAFAALL